MTKDAHADMPLSGTSLSRTCYSVTRLDYVLPAFIIQQIIREGTAKVNTVSLISQNKISECLKICSMYMIDSYESFSVQNLLNVHE